MAAGFELPPGDPDALDTALTGLGGMAGDLKHHGSTLESGFGQAIATWKAPRELDFQRAATGIRAQACNAQTSIEGAVDVLGTYAKVLRGGREDIADLARQAHHREETTRNDTSGMDPGSTHATQAEQHTAAFVGQLQAEAADIRGHVRRAAEQAAQALDQATGSVVPGGATLDPNAIRQQVDHAYGVEATRAALAGQQLTENDAWSALAGAQVSAPPDDWRAWAQAYGLNAPETFDPARGADLKKALEAELSKGLSLPPDQRAQLIKTFTDTLSQQDQVQLAMSDPSLVGNLDGIPNTVRYVANKVNVFRAVESEQERLDAWQPPPTKQDPAYVDYARLGSRIDTLSTLVNDEKLTKIAPVPPSQILAFTPPTYDGNTVTDDGRLAVVSGDLDTAHHVGVFVPGITNRIDNFAATLGQASNAQNLAGDASATVAWLGYDTPEFADSVTTDDAVRGGHALHDFMAGLQRAEGSDLTLMAHSYGTLVTSQALQFGKGEKPLPDRVVLFGSPGLGEDIHSTTDLGLPPGYPIYALRAPSDPVSITAAFGMDPVEMSGITRLDTDWTDDGREPTGHSQYTEDWSNSLVNIAGVLAGVPDDELHVGGNPLAEDGLLGAYNINLRNLVDNLQEQVPAEVTSDFASRIQGELELRIETGTLTPTSPEDLRDLVGLIRNAANDSGLNDHLSDDELHQAIKDAGFTDTLGDQAGDKVDDFFAGQDGLDDLRVPIPHTPFHLDMPDGANEAFGHLAGDGTQFLTTHLSDLAVDHLPGLDGVLDISDAAADAWQTFNDTKQGVSDAWQDVQDAPGEVWDASKDITGDVLDTGEDALDGVADAGGDAWDTATGWIP